jgi:hypothetical protein
MMATTGWPIQFAPEARSRWSHFRRRFYDLAKGGNAPIASAALDKIGALYGIEAEVRCQSADTRRAVRQERTRPLVDALKTWLGEQLAKLHAAPKPPRRSAMAPISGIRRRQVFADERSGRLQRLDPGE